MRLRWLLPVLAALVSCGAHGEAEESETHFVCSSDADCTEAGDRRSCSSGQCVVSDDGEGRDATPGPQSSDGGIPTVDDSATDDDPGTDPPGDGAGPEPTTSVPFTSVSTSPGAGGVPQEPAPGAGGAAGSFAGGAGGASGVAGSGRAGGSLDADGCAPLLAPADEPDVVELTVRNQREVPVVLGGPVACQPTVVSVESLDQELPGVWMGPHCVLPCDMQLEGAGGCTADCPFPAPVAIMPGEAATVEWSGLLLHEVQVPSECCADEGHCPTECPLVQLAPPGQYRASLAFLEVTEQEAMACSDQGPDCPQNLSPLGLEPLVAGFELGNGAIVLAIEEQ